MTLCALLFLFGSDGCYYFRNRRRCLGSPRIGTLKQQHQQQQQKKKKKKSRRSAQVKTRSAVKVRTFNCSCALDEFAFRNLGFDACVEMAVSEPKKKTK